MPAPVFDLTRIIAYADGGSRNNPGPAAFAYLIYDGTGRLVERRGEFIGEATNNVAEYRGMIAAARRAVELGATLAVFRVDSELLARQISGRYRVKSPHLKPLYAELAEALRRIPEWRIERVPRERNQGADRLVNRALDAQGVVA